MFERIKPYLLAMITAALAVIGLKLPPLTLPPVAPPPATTPTTPPTAPVTPPTQPVPPPKPPEPKPDTPKAIARIQFGNAGCSATVIGPRRQDGRYWVLTASHCVSAVGQRGSMRLLDGRVTGIQVASLDRTSDCCWCVTDTSTETLPFALLAEADPAPGTKIWHAGYGVNNPGNREDGYIVATSNRDGQIQFRLNVSSGDSGGGICVDADGKVVSTVCCTTAKGQMADVWGAGPAAIRRTQPTATMVLDEWTPSEIPIRVPKAMPSAK